MGNRAHYSQGSGKPKGPIVALQKKAGRFVSKGDNSFAFSLIGQYGAKGSLTNHQWMYVRELLDRPHKDG